VVKRTIIQILHSNLWLPNGILTADTFEPVFARLDLDWLTGAAH
jgi:hypothetical protein